MRLPTTMQDSNYLSLLKQLDAKWGPYLPLLKLLDAKWGPMLNSFAPTEMVSHSACQDRRLNLHSNYLPVLSYLTKNGGQWRTHLLLQRWLVIMFVNIDGRTYIVKLPV